MQTISEQKMFSEDAVNSISKTFQTFTLKHYLFSNTSNTPFQHSFWDYFDNKFNGVNLMSKQWENECVKGDQSVLVSMLSGYGYLASDVAEFSCCGSKRL